MQPVTLTVQDGFDHLAAVVWGDLYEVVVKRGCLAYLAAAGLLPDNPRLTPWGETLVENLHKHLHQQLEILDPSERARHSSTLNHLLITGYGLGWTVMREAIKRIDKRGERRTRGLHCPLNLRDRRDGFAEFDRSDAANAFWTAIELDGPPDEGWTDKGEAARADFFLWLVDDGDQNHLFALEFSLNAPANAEDFSESGPNLRELLSYARRLESRGVFTCIRASLAGEGFAFSDRLISHLAALTSRDKPVYKLCQASSYATRFVHRMARRGTPVMPAKLHAIAVTSGGVETIHADAGDDQDPRWRLMDELGSIYRRSDKLEDDSPAALNQEIAAVRTQLVQALPEQFRDAVALGLADSSPQTGLHLHLTEPVAGAVNPGERVPCVDLLAGLNETDEICAWLGTDHPRTTLTNEIAGEDGTTTLRDLHGQTMRRAIAHAPRGQITVIAAEGLPGVGKTTAVMRALQSLDEGFLWLYASPRLVINSQVFRDMARTKAGDPTGVLAMATNGRLISGARDWWRRKHPDDRTFVDGAVMYDGVEELGTPPGSTVLVTPREASEIEGRHSGSGLKKHVLDESTDEMKTVPPPGVYSTLVATAREVIRRNPRRTRVVLTPSIQGYRLLQQKNPEASAKTTVDSLSKLFRARSDTPEGTAERQRFGQRIPTIVVMVDEIAGDGAGAPFVHALANWLWQQFIAPFEGGDNPFRVLLVLADASFGNKAVMESYMRRGSDAPEQVLVSRSRGALPFRVDTGTLLLGGQHLDALHIMADGFPAHAVELDYQVHLTPVRLQPGIELKSTSALLAIREQEGGRTLHRAVQTIFDAVATLPHGQQAIFFAQDKKLLRTVKHGLIASDSLPDEAGTVDTHGVVLDEDDVAIIDSEIAPAERSRLLQPIVRDRKRVFLMTSSGSRGVTIPLATSIIAMVPTFAVESGFMEIAQLIYRGRGKTEDPCTGRKVDGDAFKRRLTLLLQDFIVTDEIVDQRQWLRRTIDVLSALVLLRATLLTRMTGDAGVPGQQMAVVPVGRIGTEDVATSLSEALAVFLRSGTVYLYDAKSADDFGLVKHALEGVDRFFGSFHRVARLRKDQQTVMQEGLARRIAEAAVARHAPLFGAEQMPALPDGLYVTGPVWLEVLTATASEERFNIEARTPAEHTQLDELRRQLRVIGDAWRRFPSALTESARDLLRILERPEDLQAHSFRARQPAKTVKRWICLPIEYASFCYHEGEHGREPRPLLPEEQPLWHDGLRRVVGGVADVDAIEPVIPRYEEHPFIVALSHGDPTGMARAFDDRYFMASTELNLLNTLLFVDLDV